MNAAWMEFEHGFMVWFEPDVVFAVQVDDNGKVAWWDKYQENWQEGKPVYPSEPQRGFGYVWHGVSEVQLKLGDATSPELPGQGDYHRQNDGWVVTGLDGEPLLLEPTPEPTPEPQPQPSQPCPSTYLVLPDADVEVNLWYAVIGEPAYGKRQLTLVLPAVVETLDGGREIPVLRQRVIYLTDADAAILRQRWQELSGSC